MLDSQEDYGSLVLMEFHFRQGYDLAVDSRDALGPRLDPRRRPPLMQFVDYKDGVIAQLHRLWSPIAKFNYSNIGCQFTWLFRFLTVAGRTASGSSRLGMFEIPRLGERCMRKW